jgi:hypothetical protein
MICRTTVLPSLTPPVRVCFERVYSSNVELDVACTTGAIGNMRLESEARRPSVLEQHYVHGKWRIVKIYVKGKLSEIIVNRTESQATN